MRAYQELANRGIVAPSSDERCLRDAVFAAPESQSALQQIVSSVGGPVKLTTTYCPSGPTSNYAFIEAVRLEPAQITLAQPTPPGWTLYLQPNFSHPLQRVTLQSLYEADPRALCYYEGGWVLTRSAVKCRAAAGSGFVLLGGVESQCTGDAQRCAMECAP